MANERNLKTFVLSVRRLVVGRNHGLAGERHAPEETP